MNENNKPQQNSRRLIPASEWPKYHAWPTLGGLRHLILHAKAKNFEHCVIRASRRVLIDEQAFFEWLENQNKGGVK